MARKLLIKPSMTLRLFGAPDGYEMSLARLPEGATQDTKAGEHDFVQHFASDSTALAASVAEALAALKPGGVFWVSFPKGSSKIQTDLTRDKGWDSWTRWVTSSSP